MHLWAYRNAMQQTDSDPTAEPAFAPTQKGARGRLSGRVGVEGQTIAASIHFLSSPFGAAPTFCEAISPFL